MQMTTALCELAKGRSNIAVLHQWINSKDAPDNAFYERRIKMHSYKWFYNDIEGHQYLSLQLKQIIFTKVNKIYK